MKNQRRSINVYLVIGVIALLVTTYLLFMEHVHKVEAYYEDHPVIIRASEFTVSDNVSNVKDTVKISENKVTVKMVESSIKKDESKPVISKEVLNTQDEKVIDLTKHIGPMYGIDPRLIQAIVFYESANNEDAVNPVTGCCGYMQVSEEWHRDRMSRLGVENLYDPYGNILVGTDYLSELLNRYKDLSLSLMIYNGDEQSFDLYNQGKQSLYAENIINLYEKLKTQED